VLKLVEYFSVEAREKSPGRKIT